MTPLQESIKKCTVKGNVLFLPSIKDGLLSNYNEVRTALLNAGAKYKKNTFVFPNDAQPYIDRLLNGDKVNIKKEFQFFPTPPHLADKLVKAANIKPTDKVLEPSAGQGAIVNAIVKEMPHLWVDVCEIMDINISVLTQHPNVHFICEDFLKIPANHKYDKIIANPPFNKNQDIDHIRQMWDCLKPGGRIVTIASKHWQSSQNNKEKAFRDWLGECADVEDIEAGEFDESGTKIATCMIIIDKPV